MEISAASAAGSDERLIVLQVEIPSPRYHVIPERVPTLFESPLSMTAYCVTPGWGVVLSARKMKR